MPKRVVDNGGGGGMLKRAKYGGGDESHMLNIFRKPYFDDLIVKEEVHTYLPYTQNTNNSDTIRINIQSSDIITATCDSYIKISGTYNPKIVGKNFTITNNAACFLFDEFQLKLGNNEIIDVCKTPGITSYMKGLASYTDDQMSALSILGWAPPGYTQTVFKNGMFSCCIPLKHLFGSCEDHTKVIVKMSQELIAIRAKSDVNCYKSMETEVEFKIDKISWEVPHITLSDEANLELLEKLRNTPAISMPFRRWELHEYPALPQSTKTIWRVKNANESNKPRAVIIGIQEPGKMDDKEGNATDLTHAFVTNLKVQLNTVEYPHQRMNLDFEYNDYFTAFENYKNFRSNYYGKKIHKCFLDYNLFKSHPLFIVNCKYQMESVKESPVDIKIEIEAAKNFPEGTKLFALLLYDNIIQYNPFTEVVSKVIRG